MANLQSTDKRRDALLEHLRQAGGKPLGVAEIMQRARIHPGERTAVKRALRDLTQEGLVGRDGKRFHLVGVARPGGAPPEARGGGTAGGVASPPRSRPLLAGARGTLVGTLKKHRDGFGFVARLDRKGDDVFVPPDEAAKALDADLVRIEVVPARGGRTMGRIIEVVERRRRLLIGTYHARGRHSFVVPADAELEAYVPVPETSVAVDGEVVKVAIDPGKRLAGSVVEAIGRPGEPRVEVLKVAYSKGFADVFPDDVVAAAEKVPAEVRAEDRNGRRDLTSLPLVTIDGEDARDFDDAVFVERVTRKGKPAWRLVVAIADVAHYVRPGEPLDDEANRRATSVYFPMQVLPMLPERLSNGICSLNPDVDRLCMVADLVIDGRGETVATEIYEGVMRSHARCTYNEVASVLDGDRVPHREALREDFERMAELQEKLGAMRRQRGSIDFDLPEAKIVLDAEGTVTAIEKRPRNRAHRIVEEFMLAANEAVARFFGQRELPTLYRVHGLPDEDKLDRFLELAQTHGFVVPEQPVSPRDLNALLGRFAGHAQQRALNQLLLRSLMQANYSPENIGHYGLAAEHYLHFTSPIRRYPDLIVHRLLKEEWARRRGEEIRETSPAALEEKAVLSSERERAAMEAEREIASFYAALFMKDKAGERFKGVVASVVEFGLFVELQRWFVEGLVRVEDLEGAFELDPVKHALVDVGTGRSYRVGDEVEVELVLASPERRRIELAMVEEGRGREAERAGPRGKGRAVETVETVAGGPGRPRRRQIAAVPAERTGRPRREHARGPAPGRGRAESGKAPRGGIAEAKPKRGRGGGAERTGAGTERKAGGAGPTGAGPRAGGGGGRRGKPPQGGGGRRGGRRR
jgi:ribonuclease R